MSRHCTDAFVLERVYFWRQFNKSPPRRSALSVFVIRALERRAEETEGRLSGETVSKGNQDLECLHLAAVTSLDFSILCSTKSWDAFLVQTSTQIELLQPFLLPFPSEGYVCLKPDNWKLFVASRSYSRLCHLLATHDLQSQI